MDLSTFCFSFKSAKIKRGETNPLMLFLHFHWGKYSHSPQLNDHKGSLFRFVITITCESTFNHGSHLCWEMSNFFIYAYLFLLSSSWIFSLISVFPCDTFKNWARITFKLDFPFSWFRKMSWFDIKPWFSSRRSDDPSTQNCRWW